MRALALILILFLAGCSGLGGAAVKAVAGATLGGGGPSASLDLQAGKNNSKTVGTSKTVETSGPVARPDNVGRDFAQTTTQETSEKIGSIDKIENISGSVTINNVPAWLVATLLALAFGVLILFGALGWADNVMRWLRQNRDPQGRDIKP